MDEGACGYHHLSAVYDQTIVWLRIDYRQAEVLGGGFGDVHGNLCQIRGRYTDYLRPSLAVLTA